MSLPDERLARLHVLLAGWVLQDGYDDLVAGTRREFALEFYTDLARPLQHVDGGELGLRSTGSYGDYEVKARVVCDGTEGKRQGCWVLDVGDVMAYDTHTAQIADGRRPRVGDTLRTRRSEVRAVHPTGRRTQLPPGPHARAVAFTATNANVGRPTQRRGALPPGLSPDRCTANQGLHDPTTHPVIEPCEISMAANRLLTGIAQWAPASRR